MNFIPVIICFILFYRYQGEAVIPFYLSWMFLLFWILIYLLYFVCDLVDNEYIKRLLIYSPGIIGTIAFAWFSWDIGFSFIPGYLLFVLPSFVYNIFVDYKLK